MGPQPQAIAVMAFRRLLGPPGLQAREAEDEERARVVRVAGQHRFGKRGDLGESPGLAELGGSWALPGTWTPQLTVSVSPHIGPFEPP